MWLSLWGHNGSVGNVVRNCIVWQAADNDTTGTVMVAFDDGECIKDD